MWQKACQWYVALNGLKQDTAKTYEKKCELPLTARIWEAINSIFGMPQFFPIF